YNPALLSGVFIGTAPIEDFLYGFALFYFAFIIWEYLHHPGTLSLKQAFLSSRPISWINIAFVVVVAAWLTKEGLTTKAVFTTLYFTLPFNLALYGINDIYDYPSDARNPRKNSVEGGLLPPIAHRPMWLMIALLNIPFIIYVVASGSIAAILIFLFLLFTTFAYSAPPLRLKEVPVLDSFVSATHFVTPFVFALAFFDTTNYPVLDIIAFVCWCMASQALGAIQDITVDKEVKMKSVATMLGPFSSGMYSLFLYLTAVVLVLIQGGILRVIAAALLLLFALVTAIFMMYATEHAARGAWKAFMWLNYGVGMGLTLLLIVALNPGGIL
ncbi:MAG: prenyltransferase, partial [Nanoarchaeota archaeon]